MEKNFNIWNKKYSMSKEGIIGGGGNATVYKVINNTTNEAYALKALHKDKHRRNEPTQRFKDEIKIMLQCKDIRGVLPILDSSPKHFQYIMPLAQQITEFFEKDYYDTKDFLIELLNAIIQLSETLSILHEKGISHRDIKPSNIYHYNNDFCFGDFGLVSFPDNPNDFTRSDRGLGAIFTIAPEMKRDPKNSDGKKADVYSLAKTMWILITGNEKGFDGVYDFRDKNHGLRYIEKFKDIHIVELEELLQKATSNNPYERPSINEFKTSLQDYLNILDNFDLSQESEWNFLNKHLFPFGQNSSEWQDVECITEVLNLIGTSPAYNHMMFSGNGGLDFKYATKANEPGCIYIYDTCNYCHIVKPKSLIAETFKENLTWNYFLLELDEMNPIFDNQCECEMLVEDYPNNYVSSKYWNYGVYDYDTEESFPQGAKLVYRYINGKFLFVLKGGPYNGIHATYDGRHGDCDSRLFKTYIVNLIHAYEKLRSFGLDESTILNQELFNKNPFKEQEESHDYNTKYPDDFIHDNLSNWCFDQEIQNINTSETGVKFIIEFNMNNFFDLSDIIEHKSYYLCKDGYIKKTKLSDNQILSICSREEAIQLKNIIESKITSICLENGYDSPVQIIATVEISRNNFKPTHIFTKEEIKTEMLNADDRHNNRLVIDEIGYPHVIQNIGISHSYPVSLESWDAGNVYVGKYSSLATLDDNYIMCLDGWLSYLKYGNSVRKDYLGENLNIDVLLDEIKTYY